MKIDEIFAHNGSMLRYIMNLAALCRAFAISVTDLVEASYLIIDSPALRYFDRLSNHTLNDRARKAISRRIHTI